MLKTCPNCGAEVSCAITSCATNRRYCANCVPNPDAKPRLVAVARKIDSLASAGRLDTYPIEQRLQDLHDAE